MRKGICVFLGFSITKTALTIKVVSADVHWPKEHQEPQAETHRKARGTYSGQDAKPWLSRHVS